MSQAQIEHKVQDYLDNSELLSQEWQKPITLEQLQGEMDRIAEHTKQPEVSRVRLTWSGATSTDIDVYRDGALIATTPNDGTYIDATGDTGRARYIYQVL